MGLFGKNKKGEKREEKPSLAQLPRLPELDSSNQNKMHKLPSFPSNSVGNKFSQDSIKHAVTGKRGEEEAFYADDFDSDNERMMHEPLRKPMVKELDEEIEAEKITSPEIASSKIRHIKSSTEPIFIRVDKFEDAIKIFDKAKKQITDIEHILSEINQIKEKEEKELQEWIKNIKSIKTKIEKVDRDIFSKI